MDSREHMDSEWVKAGINVEDGDLLRFLDSGKDEVNKEGKNQLVFMVGIVRDGEVIKQKKFQVNITNNKAISALYGYETKDWEGKEMKVVIVKRQNPKGELVDGVALVPPGAPVGKKQ